MNSDYLRTAGLHCGQFYFTETSAYDLIKKKKEKKERKFVIFIKIKMVIVLLRHLKQTQDFTSFPRQAIIAHQSKLNSYFRA